MKVTKKAVICGLDDNQDWQPTGEVRLIGNRAIADSGAKWVTSPDGPAVLDPGKNDIPLDPMVDGEKYIAGLPEALQNSSQVMATLEDDG